MRGSMPARTAEVASHVLEQCQELCDLALKADLDMLAHLLSMTMLQAAKHVANDGMDGTTSKR